MTQDEIFLIRKELRGLKIVQALVDICTCEKIASRVTVYTALTPNEFDPQSIKHRRIIRRAVRYLQSKGSVSDWNIDEMLPEALPLVAEAA